MPANSNAGERPYRMTTVKVNELTRLRAIEQRAKDATRCRHNYCVVCKTVEFILNGEGKLE